MRIDDDELIRRWKKLNSCHFIDLKLRLNGKDVLQQGDWIKYIIKELLERRGAIKTDNLEFLEKKEFESYLRKN
jgi:hypothetical protein